MTDVNLLVEGDYLEVAITGKLSREFYETFVPAVEEVIEAYGKVRILLILHDFHGWNVGALWEDIKFDVRHYNDIAKVGIVGDSKWEAGMANFCKPFTTAEVRYFEHKDLDAARTWVQEPKTERV